MSTHVRTRMTSLRKLSSSSRESCAKRQRMMSKQLTRRAALSLLLACVVGGANAFSSGSTVCDAISLCAGGTCPTGMEKVGPPIRSSVYRLEAESTSYEPGALVPLVIRVLQPEIEAMRNAGKAQCISLHPPMHDSNLSRSRCNVPKPHIIEPAFRSKVRPFYNLESTDRRPSACRRRLS